MIGIAVLAVYLLGWLLAAAVVTRAADRDFGHLDRTDRFMSAVLGFVTALFWPLAAPVMLVRWLADRETPAERHHRLAIEKDERVRELQRKIRGLERELGIGQAAS